MKTLQEIQAYLKQNSDMQVIILDIDDMTMGTSREKGEYIINEFELAETLKNKVVCFATDKAGEMPDVLIQFCENYQLLFAPELYGRTATLRGKLNAERNIIVDLPLNIFIHDYNFSQAEFETAITQAYRLYQNQSIEQIKPTELSDVGNLCLRIILLMIKHDKSLENIITLLVRYHDFISKNPATSTIREEGRIIQLIYKQLYSAIDIIIQEINPGKAIKLFTLVCNFIDIYGESYQGIESIKYISQIHTLTLVAAFEKLKNEEYGPAEQADIQTYLLYRLFFNSNAHFNSELRTLLGWIIDRTGKNISDPQRRFASIIEACAAIDTTLRKLTQLFGNTHPIKQLDINHLWREVLQPLQSLDSVTASSTEPTYGFDPNTATSYYRTLGEEKQIQRQFCERIFPAQFGDSRSLESRSVISASASSSYVGMTAHMVSQYVNAQVSQLQMRVRNVAFDEQGKINFSIEIQGSDGVTLVFSTTFNQLADYNSFFTEKHIVFLYLMHTLQILPNSCQQKPHITYALHGATAATVDVFFADDNIKFCGFAKEVGLTRVVHGDTPPAIDECIKFLSLLNAIILPRKDTETPSNAAAEFNIEPWYQLLPETMKDLLDLLGDAINKSHWEQVQQLINQLINSRPSIQEPEQQQTFIHQRDSAAKLVQALVDLNRLLRDVHRNLPEQFRPQYLAIKDAIEHERWADADKKLVELRVLMQLYPCNTYMLKLGGDEVASRIDAVTAAKVIHSREFRDNTSVYQQAEVTLGYPLSRALEIDPRQLGVIEIPTDSLNRTHQTIISNYQSFLSAKQTLNRLEKKDMPAVDMLNTLFSTYAASGADASSSYVDTTKIIGLLSQTKVSSLSGNKKRLKNLNTCYIQLTDLEKRLMHSLLHQLPLKMMTYQESSYTQLKISLFMFAFIEELKNHMKAVPINPKFVPNPALATPLQIAEVLHNPKFQKIFDSVINELFSYIATDNMAPALSKLLITERLTSILFARPLHELYNDAAVWSSLTTNKLLTQVAARATLLRLPPVVMVVSAPACSSDTVIAPAPPVTSPHTRQLTGLGMGSQRVLSPQEITLTGTQQTVFYTPDSRPSTSAEAAQTETPKAPAPPHPSQKY